MSNDFASRLERYAELLAVHGLNVQPGQIVNVSAEVCHRELAYLIARHAYRLGAKLVMVDLIEPRLARVRIESSSDENLTFVPQFLPVKYDELVDTTGANIRIVGSEDPDLLADLPPKRVNTAQLAPRRVLKRFYDEGIGLSRVHWTVAAGATQAWASKVFPDMDPDDAFNRLWDAIFVACRADRANCLDLWHTQNAALQRRARELTAKKIRSIRFRGPGTDLEVGLSERAIWKGGRDVSPRGVEFEPNIPTEEVFTTPDYRATTGKVRTTRPFFINGKLVRGLNVVFDRGDIVEFSAEEGEATFAEYISSDPGAKRLGEVALVGVDSPIYAMGHVFQEILFDENAACHIAIGSAYRFCLEGSDRMSDGELANVGCNVSHVHTDMMISSEQVDVSAECWDGSSLSLLKSGSWVL